ncbi:MAG: fumarate hydratase [Candidatus Bipolaricaulota bacterium]|nr:fumarate hydratase [Candidatus Bipolaricaulota bacterium]MBS3792233.1 fumarate hydratase [Candidatus Bipolaricaulota bacterium]
MNPERLARDLVGPIKKAVTTLPEPTLAALKEAREKEEDGARVQLDAILEAVEIGQKEEIPICQDTGTPTFYVQLGADYPAINQLDEIKKAFREGVQRATEEVPIRPNTVHPISGKNPGDNTGRSIPWINWDITDGTDLKVTYLPKGGGSTNMSQLTMMTPGKGIKGVKELVLKRIASMEGKPCPPTVVGVGLGGSASISMSLAKKSLLRPVDERHEDPEIADLEEELKERANNLGVGPMGVGGETTVLDVKVEHDHRHPASYPVGITPQCWANRRTSFRITPEGDLVEVGR